MAEATSTASIQGPPSATISQALSWAGDQDATLGDCEGDSQPAEIVEFLEESERLSERLGWDFAVVAAHASAATNGFTSDQWRDGFNPIPLTGTTRGDGEPVTFTGPREAAAAHVAYLTRLAGAGADTEAVRDLEEIGFTEMVPEPPETPRGAESGARTLDDLASNSVDRATLQHHLAGIRREAEPDPGEGTRAALPPLPEIKLVESDAFFEGRSGVGPVAICYHMTWDLNLDRVLRLFRHRENNKSANFVIARDGMVYQCVHSRNAAWTNGDYKKKGVWKHPRTDIPWLKRAVEAAERGGPNLNRYTISYEFIGTPEDPAWEAQYRSAIMLSRHLCAKYNIPGHRGRQIRHADINSVDRSYDPGPRFDLARIIRELGGDPSNLTA